MTRLDYELLLEFVFGGPDGPGGPFPGDGPFVPAFEDWLASGEAAMTMNDDGEIDEEDFKLFVDRLFEGGPDGPFPGDGPFVPDFEDWLASGEAEDLNEDGEIDEADYELLLEFVFGGPDGPGGPFPGDGPFVPEFEDWLATKQPMTITTMARSTKRTSSYS